MSLSRWTASTRGVSSWASTAGAAASAPRASERARNPRKMPLGTGVRILSAEVRRSCPRTVLRPPWKPVRRLLLVPAALARRACSSLRRRSGRSSSRVTTVELRPSGAPTAVSRFTLAGVQWRGPGEVLFRTRSVDGGWSSWRAGCAGGRGRPGRRARASARRNGWKLGNPFWVGASDRIQARAVGKVTRVRAHLVWSPELRVPYRVHGRRPRSRRRSSRGSRGARTSRSGAGRRATPPSVRFAVVHHTAGRNDYSRAEARRDREGHPALPRAGERLERHRLQLPRRSLRHRVRGPVRRRSTATSSAHTRRGSTPAPSASRCSGRTGVRGRRRRRRRRSRGSSSWRLDLAHVDPTSFLTFISGGSNRYASGIPVLLSAVTGHRDTGFTECPGDALEARLPAIAGTARELGGLKIFEPETEVDRIARPRAGQAVAPRCLVGRDHELERAPRSRVARARGPTSTGRGTRPGRRAGSYTWTVSAGSARPAAGILRAGGGSPRRSRSRAWSRSPRRSAPTATGRPTRPCSRTASPRRRT